MTSASQSARQAAAPLAGYFVVDLSSGIPGGYCTKVLADAGASVVKLEAPEGDRLRSWSATGASLGGEDGALFQFLACSKQSVVANPDDPGALDLPFALIGAADAVVWSPESRLAALPALAPWSLRARFPHLDVLAITLFGLEGPWADKAATEFTMQAWAGGIGHRGSAARPPVSVGGRVGEWAAGIYGACSLLASRRRSARLGVGELLDASVFEAVALTLTNLHPVSYYVEAGRPQFPKRWTVLPAIHPTRDGWIGFMVATGQQWQDFCVLVERIDWMDDMSLLRAPAREARRTELTAHIESWTETRTTAEILRLATDLRVPIAPIGTGSTVAEFDQFVARGMFTKNPRGGFTQPTVPYRLSEDAQVGSPGPPPLLGEHTTDWASRPTVPRAPALGPDEGPRYLPFDDLRVVEMTAFWAGPSAGQFLGMLGAEVIKVEGPRRPDSARSGSTRSHDEDEWWEYAPSFHSTNTDKLGLSIQLDTPRGIKLMRDLLDRSDVLLENYSPRVLENWGLDYEVLRRTNPRLIVVRMPAFGLSGPWRERTGFAQTMEQASGMAWVTGYPDAAPTLPNGPCDPIAGAHAVLALELALAHRERTGEGMLVEVPMVASALNIAAEQVVEYSAYGKLLTRAGNRGTTAAPQNLYRTGDPDDGVGGPLVAIAIETDEQWRALSKTIGRPNWLDRGDLAHADGRRADQDAIDAELGNWCQTRTGDEIVDLLWSVQVPVGKVLMPHEPDFTQLESRGFFERIEHPVVGAGLLAGLPVRFSCAPHQFHRRHAPLLGEHNAQILRGILGLSPEEFADLEAAEVIGNGLRRNASAL